MASDLIGQILDGQNPAVVRPSFAEAMKLLISTPGMHSSAFDTMVATGKAFTKLGGAAKSAGTALRGMSADLIIIDELLEDSPMSDAKEVAKLVKERLGELADLMTKSFASAATENVVLMDPPR